MTTIDTYLDTAKNLHSVSDRKLTKLLGISQTTISFWRTRRTWPNANDMITLARLAGMDEEIALIHLNCWKSDGNAQQVFMKIAKKLAEQKVKEFA